MLRNHTLGCLSSSHHQHYYIFRIRDPNLNLHLFLPGEGTTPNHTEFTKLYPLGNKHIPTQGIFEDDFPFPKVGYVSSLEGNPLLNGLWVTAVSIDASLFMEFVSLVPKGPPCRNPPSRPQPLGLPGDRLSLQLEQGDEEGPLSCRKSGWWQLKDFLCSSLTLGKWSNLTGIFFKWVGSTTN